MEKFLLLKKRIKKNEGFRSRPYLDSLGYPTIGYGHLITKKEKKMFQTKFSKKFLSNLFDKDFKKAITAYKKNFNIAFIGKDKEEKGFDIFIQI